MVLIPGIGMFTCGKSKTEARLTGEFYAKRTLLPALLIQRTAEAILFLAGPKSLIPPATSFPWTNV